MNSKMHVAASLSNAAAGLPTNDRRHRALLSMWFVPVGFAADCQDSA